jgi:hypothetical protein
MEIFMMVTRGLYFLTARLSSESPEPVSTDSSVQLGEQEEAVFTLRRNKAGKRVLE